MGALTLRNNLMLGLDEGSAVPVDDELLGFSISAKVTNIDVPATAGVAKHVRGGATEYAVKVDYLSNDIPDSLQSLLWEALTGEDKTVWFSGSFRNDAVSAANPEWSGTAVVSSAEVGGEAEGLSQSSVTMPMTGAPVRSTT